MKLHLISSRKQSKTNKNKIFSIWERSKTARKIKSPALTFRYRVLISMISRKSLIKRENNNHRQNFKNLNCQKARASSLMIWKNPCKNLIRLLSTQSKRRQIWSSPKLIPYSPIKRWCLQSPYKDRKHQYLQSPYRDRKHQGSSCLQRILYQKWKNEILMSLLHSPFLF